MTSLFCGYTFSTAVSSLIGRAVCIELDNSILTKTPKCCQIMGVPMLDNQLQKKIVGNSGSFIELVFSPLNIEYYNGLNNFVQ